MDIDDMLRKPAFKNLDENRAELLKKIYSEIKGKNKMEQMMLLMSYSKSLSEGEPLQKEEKELMIETFMEGLPLDEKKQFQKVIKMMDLIDK